MNQISDAQHIFELDIEAGATIVSLIEGLAAGSCRTGSCAGQMLRAVGLAEPGGTIELVRCTVSGLGFGDPARFDEICAHSAECGLTLCPAFAGPCLRLAYRSQPRGDWLYIAMAPLADEEGAPCIFSLDRDQNFCWLRGMVAAPATLFHPVDSFLFAR